MKKFTEHHKAFDAALLAEENVFGQPCYDATWILALALQNTIKSMYFLFFILHLSLLSECYEFGIL